ncbi:MAG: hypothetical protein RR319_04835 [Bacteroides sp.]
MRKNYFILCILCLWSFGVSAQSLEQAKALFKNNEFSKALPTFKKYVKNNPRNASYNHWYGVCLYETDNKSEAEKYLLVGAEKNVQESFRYLGELYFDSYRFDESVENYEAYITMLEKKKTPTDKYLKTLEIAKLAARMIKGVEQVTIVDSFVVNKNEFLDAYKISEEAGKLFGYNQYFEEEGNNQGTVYQTELANKIYYSKKGKGDKLNLYSKTKQIDDWGKETPLAGSINASGEVNYPYILSDGVTLYYASNGEGSIGGYDIFVTRYDTETDSYLVPDNVGMPFNSIYNDYMYVVDEYNNLGWFASDRYQPKNKVCVYVFIPNASKQTFNFEDTDNSIISRAAKIESIKGTWKNIAEVKAAKQRLTMAIYHKPEEKQIHDFEFIVDDNTLYYSLNDFASPEVQKQFKEYQQKEKDYKKLTIQLNELRCQYAKSNKATKTSMTAGILDLEKRVEEMEQELKLMQIDIRNEEKNFISK